MKVTIATGLYPPEIGGPATHTVLLEKGLPAHGWTVSVVAFRDSRKYPKGIRHLHYLLRLLKASRGAEVIFAQDVASVGFPALVVARLLQKKFIVRVPGDYAWEQSTQRYGVKESIDDFQTQQYGGKVENLRRIQKTVTQKANRVVTPSDYFKKLVSGWGVSPEQIVTIYNGVNLDVQPHTPRQLSGKIMVTSGRLVPWKGMAMLIEMMSELPDWQLVILGEGPEQVQLEQQAHAHGVAERVHFEGIVPRDLVAGWCQAADAFVLNTHFESFSYQIVEAMAMNVPVITTAVGSLPELIESEKEGVLLRPDDKAGFLEAIQSVANGSRDWNEISNQAVQKAQQFNAENTVEQFSDLFTRVAAEK